MNLEELAKRQEELLGGVQEALKNRGLDKRVLTQPVELLKARSQRLGERIEALKASRELYLANIDAQIEQLKNEAGEIEGRIKLESASLRAADTASRASASSRSKVASANTKAAATARTKAAAAGKGKTAAKSPSNRERKG